MKKKYYLLFVLISSFTFGQTTLPLYDGFNYTQGESLSSQSEWSNISTSVDEIISIDDNLDIIDLEASSGNAMTFSGPGSDTAIQFTAQNSGKIYSSFALKVTDISGLTNANGGYFAILRSSTGGFASTLWLRQSTTDNTKFNVGINKAIATGDVQWYSTPFSTNTILFLVMAYDLGSTKSASLWVNPSSVDFGSITAPTPTIHTEIGATDRTNINQFVIRQDSGTETPSIVIDEVRVATSWLEVTPAATLSVTNFNLRSKIKATPNPSSDQIQITGLTQKENYTIYSALGERILNNSIYNNEIIHIDNLTKGIYFIKFDNGAQLKFIKK